MKFLLGVCCFAFCLLAVDSRVISFTDCGSTATIISAEILPCVNVSTAGSRCDLPRNENATFTITFTTTSDIEQVNHVVGGRLMCSVREIPFNQVRGSACHLMSPVACPLRAGRTYTYSNTFLILPSYPLLQVCVVYKLTDQNGDPLVCLDINTRITDKNVKRRTSRRRQG